MSTEESPRLDRMRDDLDAVDGTVSLWVGAVGAQPTYTRHPNQTHAAASTMKTAVLLAAYRLADAGVLDLDGGVHVHDEFTAATGAGTFRSTADYDSDPEPWSRLGEDVPLHWLLRRMIVKSSNLATNLVLERIGFGPVRDAWHVVGASQSMVERGIQDHIAREAGHANVVSAADLAALLTAIQQGTAASASACQEMLEILAAQEVTDDVVRGLPQGTRVAHKNGWVEGVRHSSALIYPADAPPYVQVVLVSATIDNAAACDLIAGVTATIWVDRHRM